MKLKRLLLFFVTSPLFVSSLSGCSGTPGSSDVDPADQPIQPEDHLLPKPSWAIPIEEMTSYNEDIFAHQNTYDDVPINFTFDIFLDRASESFGDYLRVYDSTRYQYSLKFDNVGSSRYRVSPNKHYEAGRYYTIEFLDNAPFHMADKDPSIKEFHFNTASFGDKETYNVKSNVHRFLLSDVISKQEFNAKSDDGTFVMIVKNKLNLSKGDHFLFWDGEQIDRHAFYGKFDHEETIQGHIHVYYTSPELGEIFGEDGLDVSYHNYVPTEIYDLVLASENEIKENLENNEDLKEYIYYAYRMYEPDKPHLDAQAVDWITAMKSLQILPQFGFYWPGWSFSLSVRVTVPFKYASLTFFWNYYRQSTLSCDASLSLRECAGVPYWADLAVDVSEVVDTSYRFSIIVGDNIPTTDIYDDDQAYDSMANYAQKNAESFDNADKKMQTIKDSGKDGVAFDGKTLNIKLGTGRFPIGWVFDIFIDFSFTLKLEATVMLSMSYSEHSESNILSYRSGDEDKSSHSVSSLASSSKTIILLGQIGIDVGLFLKFGIGVCGLEDYISFSIHANVGIYVSFGGYGMWTYTTTPQGKSFSGRGGLLFEVGWFASVGIELAIFFVDLSCDFVSIRQPFYSTTSGQYFVAPPDIEGNTIHLETHKVSVKSLGLLIFGTFSAAFMKLETSDFDPEVELDYVDDHGDDQHGKVFKFSFESGKYIRYENGYLIIDDDCPCKFTDTMYVDVPHSLYELKEGQDHFIAVTIDFYDYQARPVYFDGEFVDYYRYGDTLKIPGSPGDKEGYRFYGWQSKENDYFYGEGESFIVPVPENLHDKVEFSSYYYKIIYHNVTFYDGRGNVISSNKVEEGTDAVEPTAAERDKNMPNNALFVGWSTEFTNVFYDTDVYAVYIYIDGVNS